MTGYPATEVDVMRAQAQRKRIAFRRGFPPNCSRCLTSDPIGAKGPSARRVPPQAP